MTAGWAPRRKTAAIATSTARASASPPAGAVSASPRHGVCRSISGRMTPIRWSTTPLPLRRRWSFIGEPQALLHVSSQRAEVAYFHVRLCEVAPDGASRLISAGGLLATHRASRDRPQPLEPGQIYELRFPLRHCAYALTPGNRLRVAVASAEFQNAWPTGVPARNTVFWGPRHPSGVVLPIADSNRATPPPRFEDSPIAALRGAPAPTYAIHHDLVADTVICEIANVDQNEHNVSRYTVSNLDPAATVIESSCRYRPQRAGKATQIDASCRTSSEATQYSHSIARRDLRRGTIAIRQELDGNRAAELVVARCSGLGWRAQQSAQPGAWRSDGVRRAGDGAQRPADHRQHRPQRGALIRRHSRPREARLWRLC